MKIMYLSHNSWPPSPASNPLGKLNTQYFTSNELFTVLELTFECSYVESIIYSGMEAL